MSPDRNTGAIEFALRKSLHGPDGTLAFEAAAVIEKGGFVTLFGPSGAGKTTLLRMLAGLTPPDAGRIVVDGECWFDAERRIDLPPQRRSIGFVFQDYALFPNLTVRENIAYALGKGRGEWIEELLESTALQGVRDRLPQTLSGGQKQRVALARALARKPKLLLLDEPLSALDLGLRTQLQDQIAQLHRRFGLTTLLVSHDLGEVFKLSQRVLRIEHGAIVQSGTPAELFLQQRLGGRINLRAQVLAIRREDVVFIVSLLLGQDIVEVIATNDDIEAVEVGDFVEIAAKAFSPLIFK
ncbi:MAG TPA: ABC transporter ATP-binding protein [Paucimonas sp.]|nr:ABC transporter ATP-binding protein [Paucimonas sp.]